MKVIGCMLFNFKEVVSVFLVNLCCGLFGFVMGVLFGVGVILVSVVVYMIEKKLVGVKGEFGKGDMCGLVVFEIVIGVFVCGVMVLMLIFGVFGLGIIVVMIGVLILYNIIFGLLLF